MKKQNNSHNKKDKDNEDVTDLENLNRDVMKILPVLLNKYSSDYDNRKVNSLLDIIKELNIELYIDLHIPKSFDELFESLNVIYTKTKNTLILDKCTSIYLFLIGYSNSKDDKNENQNYYDNSSLISINEIGKRHFSTLLNEIFLKQITLSIDTINEMLNEDNLEENAQTFFESLNYSIKRIVCLLKQIDLQIFKDLIPDYYESFNQAISISETLLKKKNIILKEIEKNNDSTIIVDLDNEDNKDSMEIDSVNEKNDKQLIEIEQLIQELVSISVSGLYLDINWNDENERNENEKNEKNEHKKNENKKNKDENDNNNENENEKNEKNENEKDKNGKDENEKDKNEKDKNEKDKNGKNKNKNDGENENNKQNKNDKESIKENNEKEKEVSLENKDNENEIFNVDQIKENSENGSSTRDKSELEIEKNNIKEKIESLIINNQRILNKNNRKYWTWKSRYFAYQKLADIYLLCNSKFDSLIITDYLKIPALSVQKEMEEYIEDSYLSRKDYSKLMIYSIIGYQLFSLITPLQKLILNGIIGVESASIILQWIEFVKYYVESNDVMEEEEKSTDPDNDINIINNYWVIIGQKIIDEILNKYPKKIN
ncbi:hypothetical protein H8356DRAFT_1088657 [Neocallimastix lanati (nom. inval.)]|nr:hypothetical protein H8356DRAFT_1088657 [Neocallimastix sp. JGI-2020a]